MDVIQGRATREAGLTELATLSENKILVEERKELFTYLQASRMVAIVSFSLSENKKKRYIGCGKSGGNDISGAKRKIR